MSESLKKTPAELWEAFLELARTFEISDFDSLVNALQTLFENGHQGDYTKKLCAESLAEEHKGSCVTFALAAAAFAIVHEIGTPYILVQGSKDANANHGSEDDKPHKRHAAVVIDTSQKAKRSEVLDIIDQAIEGGDANPIIKVLDHTPRHSITVFGETDPKTHLFFDRNMTAIIYSTDAMYLNIEFFIAARQVALQAALKKAQANKKAYA